jgi:hypothetical protein
MAEPLKDDYSRTLGVIEALTVVTKQCPNGSVRSCAEASLAAIRAGGASTLRDQAYLVLTAMRGWRGDRAAQVHRSLSAFLEPPERDPRD